VQEGLPSSEVYHILQDSKGFLWFSTDNGVARYDGFQFKTFNVAEGLPDPVVFETMEDSLRQIWIRTYSGKIGYIKNDKFVAYKFNNELSMACRTSYLSNLVPGKNGSLWFSSGGIGGVIDSTGQMILDTTNLFHINYRTVGRGFITNREANSLGYTDVLINGRKFPIELTDDPKDPKTLHNITQTITWKGSLYLTVNNNIFKYDGEKVERVFRGDRAVIMLSTDHQNNLWVGLLSGGVKRFPTDDFSNGWDFPGLENITGTKVLEDHEGGLWISTLENGVFYFPNLNIRHYSMESKSKIKSVASSKNRVYVGEYDGAIISVDAASKKQQLVKKFDRSVLALYNDKKNRLWASGDYMSVFNEKNEETIKSDAAAFRDITQDAAGNTWAIAASALWHFDDQGDLADVIHKKISVRNLVAIDTLLIMGTHTGIQIYDQELNLLRSPKELENLKISSVTELNDTTILVATAGNSFFITNKKFDHFYHFQLQARNIYSVLQVASQLWLGTEKGILIAPLEAILNRRADFEILSQKSGLQSDQVYFLARVNNEVFAFNENDFTVIQVSEKRFVNKSPTFYVKNIKINNQLRSYTNELDLPFDQNHIQIGFGFISYNHQDIQVRYRLDETESWNYTTERVINLYSLSPGKYAVELQYSIDRTHWKKVPLTSRVYISPPWWGTIWFQLLSIVVILLFIFLYVRNRYKNLSLKNSYQQQLLRSEIDASERERLRIAQELHDRVGTDLSAMKMIVGQILQKTDDHQKRRIENNFQEIIREIKDIIYNLSPPGLERFGLFQTVKNYIEKLQSIGPQITLNTFGSNITNPELGIAIFRVLQELISNSLKYSSAHVITIHINSFPDLVSIVYEDNGKGFIPALQKTGMGLQNIEARIRSVDGQITFESGPFGVSYSIDIPLARKKSFQYPSMG
jgi:signal transduction histidine kinase